MLRNPIILIVCLIVQLALPYGSFAWAVGAPSEPPRLARPSAEVQSTFLPRPLASNELARGGHDEWLRGQALSAVVDPPVEVLSECRMAATCLRVDRVRRWLLRLRLPVADDPPA